MIENKANGRDPFNDLLNAVLTGGLSRRDVLKRGMALGLSASMLGPLLAACGDDDDDDEPIAMTVSTPAETGAGSTPDAAGPTATRPETAATSAATSPPAADSGRTRGQGDLLRILYWQAPPMLNPHFANGNLISAPAAPVLETLVRVNPAGEIVPVQCEEAPSLENGGISEDGKIITYTLLEGLLWSDGTPLTSEDARFTWEWVVDPAAGTTSAPAFANVDDVEIVDERTFRIHLTVTDPAWYNIFGRGTSNGAPILPKHLLQDHIGANAQSAPFNLNPVGTGPYKVTNFVPGDVVNYEINENYRVPDKPYFKRVEYKGGGDAPSAARAVLQSNEVDYALNLQVEKTVLDGLLAEGNGELIVLPDGSVEHVFFNFADPNEEVDGARSEPTTEHPFLIDIAVRQALALALDRDTIVEELYGQTADPTANVITAPDIFVSSNTSYTYDPDEAAAMLDASGWAMSGSTPSKDGVETSMLFQTTISPLRLKAQEIMKQEWDNLGFQVELKSIDSAVFFSSDAGNPDTWKHFYADIQMLALNGRPFPVDLMSYWKSSDPAADIAQQSNAWAGRNLSRWTNDEYNQLYADAQDELDPARQSELFIAMNDIIVTEFVTIPFIARKRIDAKNKRLKGNNPGPWTEETYDIADWYFEEE